MSLPKTRGKRNGRPSYFRSTPLVGPRNFRSLDIFLPSVSLLLIVIACFIWPIAYPIPAPVGGDVLEADLPIFSNGHILGTDTNGNDSLSRILHGGRASLLIALAVNLIGLLVGGFVGVLAGYRGGMMDSCIMRTLDVLIAFPSLVLVLAVAQVLGPGQVNTIIALASFSVPAFARVARAATLRLRDEPFMIAALLSGSRTHWILVRHVTPNIAPQLATFGLLGMGVVIGLEGALTFLGMGIRPPDPSWGNMIFQGQQSLLTRPLLVLLPGSMLFLTILSLNLLGEALRTRWSRI